MILESTIKKSEDTELHLLTTEDFLILQYASSYREANLWYCLIKSVACLEIKRSFAKKGKASILKALQIEQDLLKFYIQRNRNVTVTYVNVA